MSPRPKTLPPATDSRLGAFFKSIGGMPRAYFKQYGALKIAAILLAAYIALFSYAPVGALGSAGGFVDPDVGFIIDPNSPERTEAGVILTRGVERAIVASNNFQMVCLGITRVSAFFMYPGTHLDTASHPSCSLHSLFSHCLSCGSQRWCSFFSLSSGQLWSSSVTLPFPFFSIKTYTNCTSTAGGSSLSMDFSTHFSTSFAGQTRETCTS
jgi:hypothetical protein